MGRQQTIPGTEAKKIDEVDAAAEAYVKARDSRMRKTDLEVEAKTALIVVMQKHKLSVYKDSDAVPPLIVTLTEGEVKVKVTQAETDEEAAKALAGDED